jgi:hypothetical protein
VGDLKLADFKQFLENEGFQVFLFSCYGVVSEFSMDHCTLEVGMRYILLGLFQSNSEGTKCVEIQVVLVCSGLAYSILKDFGWPFLGARFFFHIGIDVEYQSSRAVPGGGQGGRPPWAPKCMGPPHMYVSSRQQACTFSLREITQQACTFGLREITQQR